MTTVSGKHSPISGLVRFSPLLQSDTSMELTDHATAASVSRTSSFFVSSDTFLKKQTATATETVGFNAIPAKFAASNVHPSYSKHFRCPLTIEGCPDFLYVLRASGIRKGDEKGIDTDVSDPLRNLTSVGSPYRQTEYVRV